MCAGAVCAFDFILAILLPPRGGLARDLPLVLPFPLRLGDFCGFSAVSAREAARGFSASSSEFELREEYDTRRRLVGGSPSPLKASLRKDDAGESGPFSSASEGTTRLLSNIHDVIELEIHIPAEPRMSEDGLWGDCGIVIC